VVEPHDGFDVDPFEVSQADAITPTPDLETDLSSTSDMLPAPQAPETSDRFSTRLLQRLADKAEAGALAMSERRTATELGKEQLDSGRAVARKIGAHVDRAADKTKDFVQTNLVETAIEVGTGLKESGQLVKAEVAKAKDVAQAKFTDKIDGGRDRVQGFKDKREARQTAAAERKQARIDLRQTKADIVKTQKEARLNERLQAQTDRREKRADNVEALKNRSRLVGRLGKTMLKNGALITMGSAAYAAEAGAKGTKRTFEAGLNGGRNISKRAGDKIEAAVNYGTRVVDTYAEKLEKEAILEKSKRLEAARATLSEAKAKAEEKKDKKIGRSQAKYDKKVA